MQYLDTDIDNYLEPLVANGFPPSSVRTREFAHNFDSYRDSVVHFSDMSPTLIQEKQRLIKEFPEGTFDQTTLSAADDEWFRDYIVENFVPDYIEQNMGTAIPTLQTLCDVILPCDLAILRRNDDGTSIDFVHLAFPNGWSAEEAIGKPFSYFHEHVTNPVTDRAIVPSNPKFTDHLIDSGKTYERVGAITIYPHCRFNRHPTAIEKEPWPHVFKEDIYIRFERQTIVSVPEMESFLFFIHTNIVDFRARPKLIYDALLKTTPEYRYYEDTVGPNFDHFLTYLQRYM